MASPATRLNGAQITSLGTCPVTTGAGGLWWDGNTTGPKWRKADGTDVTLGAGGGGGSGTVTNVATGTGLTGGPITTTGTLSIDSTVATLTGSQTLTNKTLTAPIISGTITLPANAVASTGSAATNTVGLLFNSTVANGATSFPFDFNSITSNTTNLFRIQNAGFASYLFTDNGSQTNLNLGRNFGLVSNGNASLILSQPGSTATLQFTGSHALTVDAGNQLITSLSRETLISSGLRYKRTTFSDANYTVLQSDLYVAQIGTLSASRTVTLPAASVSTGKVIQIADESGTAGLTNTLVITRAGSDTINGATTNTINAAFGVRKLISDGTSKWTVLASA